MGRKKKVSLVNINDFFGAYSAYKIFALKSELSPFPFVNELGHSLSATFTVLPNYKFVSNKLSAYFTVFYAEFAQKESIHCLLLENKTETNQQELFDSKSDIKPHLLNYSLFEEYLYLFNNNGLRCFDLELSDMDYLLLLFSKKTIENEVFNQFLNHIHPFHAVDVSYLLERKQTSTQTMIVSFLRDFYCKYEVTANQLSRRKKMDLLFPVKQIPNQNLQSPIPIMLENESVANNLQLSEEYIKFFNCEY